VRTVIVRLSEPSGDGRLHGLVEAIGDAHPRPFPDEHTLLRLLKSVAEDTAQTAMGPGGDDPDGPADLNST
jgi:hypothetical protein